MSDRTLGVRTDGARRRLLALAGRTALAAPIAATSLLTKASVSQALAAPPPGTPGRALGCENGQGEGLVNNPFCTCFLAGTMIRMAEGEKPIEQIRIGDEVQTSDGALKTVRWLAVRTVARGAGQDWTADLLPVLVQKNAIADGCPSQDLWISPAHSILVGGKLVAAAMLVNGLTIRQEQSEAETITYYHVELEDHRIIIANGLEVESLLVTRSANGHRRRFDNYDEFVSLYGDLDTEMTPCAEMIHYRPEGGWGAIAMMRASVYPLVDIRDAAYAASDRISERAQRLQDAA